MEKIRYFMIFEGNVQQVGFRMFAQMKAITYNITGYAKNLSNGMVEVCAQGTKDNLDKFTKELKKGNIFIKVSNVTIKQIPAKFDEKKFICL